MDVGMKISRLKFQSAGQLCLLPVGTAGDGDEIAVRSTCRIVVTPLFLLLPSC